MRRLWVVLAFLVVAVAACSSPAPSPPAAAPPIVFEPGAAAVPCETGYRCFPVTDIQHDVMTPLTAAGYDCVAEGGGTGALCGPTGDPFRMEIGRKSVIVVLMVDNTADPAAGVAQITTGLRAVLPLLFPHFPGAQQFFLQQLHTAATAPHACLPQKSVGHGYIVSCLGRTAPAGAPVANTVRQFIIAATTQG